MVARYRNIGSFIECLHVGFCLVAHNGLAVVTGCDIEIRTQTRILLKPEFIVAFQPVDLAVLVCEPCDSAVHLIVVHHGSDLIILIHCLFQFLRKCVIRIFADAERCSADFLPGFRKLVIRSGKIG